MNRYLLLAAALLLSTQAAAAEVKDPWSQWTDLESINYGGSEERYGLAGGTAGGKVYAIGGTNGFKPLSLVRYFDPNVGYWREGPPLTTPRSRLAVAVSGGVLYAIGGAGGSGSTALSTVEALDPRIGRWKLKSPMPTPRYGLSVAVHDGAIYAVGGRDGDGVVAAVEVYDPKKDAWIKRAPLPDAVDSRASLAVMDGMLYLFGGRGAGACLGKVQAYNPSSDLWAVESNIPAGDCYLSVAVVEDEIYSFGAIHRKGVETAARALTFSPKTGRWQTKPYDRPFIEDFALAALNGKFYFMGGKQGGSAKTSMRVFDSGTIAKPEPQPIPSDAQAGSVPLKRIPSDVDGFAGKTAPRSSDFAVVVGIQKYRGVMEADYAERDAAIFKQYAQSVLGVPNENIILLLNQQASQADLTKYLEEWLPRNVTKTSRVIFYFSGHGAPDPEGGNSYLVPWDGDPSYLKTKAYSVARLYSGLASLRAKEVVVLLDACFSGTGPRSLLSKGLRPLVAAVQTPLPRGGKLAVLTAASSNEVAGTFEEQGHGLFTYFVLKGLKGQAGADGHLALDGLYRYVNDNVSTAARRQNREQTPQMFSVNPQLKLY